MPRGSDAGRPLRRHPAIVPALLTAFLALLFLLPNPVLDRAASGLFYSVSGIQVKFHRLRPVSWRSASFVRAEFLLKGQTNPIQAHNGGVLWRPARGLLRFWARDVEWEGRKAGSSLRGGLRFDGGRATRLSTAAWLPREIWGRFPQVVEKRFARDSLDRRFFKLTWNQGLWRLWGRSAPVLEARWS